jgi:hypothetical protein
MKASFEKLVPPSGESFRCFNRKELRTTVKWHRHPEIELNYVEKGRGTRLVGDHIDTYGDGDLVLIGPDIPHTWLSDDYIGKRANFLPFPASLATVKSGPRSVRGFDDAWDPFWRSKS